jgi:hypothetical protein
VQERFYTFLASKVTSIEERGYDERNTLVKVSWEDPSKEARTSECPCGINNCAAVTFYLPFLQNTEVSSQKLPWNMISLRAFCIRSQSSITVAWRKSGEGRIPIHHVVTCHVKRLCRSTALTTLELKNLVSDDLQEAKFFVDSSFHFREEAKTEEAIAYNPRVGTRQYPSYMHSFGIMDCRCRPQSWQQLARNVKKVKEKHGALQLRQGLQRWQQKALNRRPNRPRNSADHPAQSNTSHLKWERSNVFL